MGAMGPGAQWGLEPLRPAEYFKTQPVLKAWLFGSFARGEQTAIWGINWGFNWGISLIITIFISPL
jgi:hypothetical protein